MSTMTAHFRVEGFNRERGIRMDTERQPKPVCVTLMTDGTAVLIEPGFTNERIALTPLGWQQLGVYAEQLVKRANEAWERMGAGVTG